MGRYYTHEKRIGCYEKKQVLENKKKRKKSVKLLCDEIKEITYTGEQQQKYRDEKQEKDYFKNKKEDPSRRSHSYLTNERLRKKIANKMD